MSEPRLRRWRWKMRPPAVGYRLLVLCLGALTLLCACGVYVPEGSTVVVVENANREFDRAEMRPVDEFRSGELIRMKWYDTNTYITSGTLTPGTYSFRARRYEGGGLERKIEIVAGQNLYKVDAGSGGPGTDEAEASGPVVTGRLALAAGQRRPATVSILFIGDRIEMRTADVGPDGSFTSEIPRKGIWRVEVHVTGTPPFSYVRPKENIQGDLALGDITLQ